MTCPDQHIAEAVGRSLRENACPEKVPNGDPDLVLVHPDDRDVTASLLEKMFEPRPIVFEARNSLRGLGLAAAMASMMAVDMDRPLRRLAPGPKKRNPHKAAQKAAKAARKAGRRQRNGK